MSIARILAVPYWPMPPAYTPAVAQAIHTRIEWANRAVRRREEPRESLQRWQQRYGVCTYCSHPPERRREVSA